MTSEPQRHELDLGFTKKKKGNNNNNNKNKIK
jgi:hypothetical protein